ncbi:MAG: hypothetical protein ABJA62_00875 [Luteimonas sp.]
MTDETKAAEQSQHCDSESDLDAAQAKVIVKREQADCTKDTFPIESASVETSVTLQRTAAERSRIANAHLFRLNTRRAAKYIGVSKRTMEYWREDEVGPPYLRIGYKIWYELPALNKWVSEQPEGRDVETDALASPVLHALHATCTSEPTQLAIGNLTRTQTAAFLGISIRTVDSWRGRSDKPQPMHNGTKRVRYSIAELDTWIKEQQSDA